MLQPSPFYHGFLFFAILCKVVYGVRPTALDNVIVELHDGLNNFVGPGIEGSRVLNLSDNGSNEPNVSNTSNQSEAAAGEPLHGVSTREDLTSQQSDGTLIDQLKKKLTFRCSDCLDSYSSFLNVSDKAINVIDLSKSILARADRGCKDKKAVIASVLEKSWSLWPISYTMTQWQGSVSSAKQRDTSNIEVCGDIPKALRFPTRGGVGWMVHRLFIPIFPFEYKFVKGGLDAWLILAAEVLIFVIMVQVTCMSFLVMYLWVKLPAGIQDTTSIRVMSPRMLWVRLLQTLLRSFVALSTICFGLLMLTLQAQEHESRDHVLFMWASGIMFVCPVVTAVLVQNYTLFSYRRTIDYNQALTQGIVIQLERALLERTNWGKAIIVTQVINAVATVVRLSLEDFDQLFAAVGAVFLQLVAMATLLNEVRKYGDVAMVCTLQNLLPLRDHERYLALAVEIDEKQFGEICISTGLPFKEWRHALRVALKQGVGDDIDRMMSDTATTRDASDARDATLWMSRFMATVLTMVFFALIFILFLAAQYKSISTISVNHVIIDKGFIPLPGGQLNPFQLYHTVLFDSDHPRIKFDFYVDLQFVHHAKADIAFGPKKEEGQLLTPDKQSAEAAKSGAFQLSLTHEFHDALVLGDRFVHLTPGRLNITIEGAMSSLTYFFSVLKVFRYSIIRIFNPTTGWEYCKTWRQLERMHHRGRVIAFKSRDDARIRFEVLDLALVFTPEFVQRVPNASSYVPPRTIVPQVYNGSCADVCHHYHSCMVKKETEYGLCLFLHWPPRGRSHMCELFNRTKYSDEYDSESAVKTSNFSDWISQGHFSLCAPGDEIDETDESCVLFQKSPATRLGAASVRFFTSDTVGLPEDGEERAWSLIWDSHSASKHSKIIISVKNTTHRLYGLAMGMYKGDAFIPVAALESRVDGLYPFSGIHPRTHQLCLQEFSGQLLAVGPLVLDDNYIVEISNLTNMELAMEFVNSTRIPLETICKLRENGTMCDVAIDDRADDTFKPTKLEVVGGNGERYVFRNAVRFRFWQVGASFTMRVVPVETRFRANMSSDPYIIRFGAQVCAFKLTKVLSDGSHHIPFLSEAGVWLDDSETTSRHIPNVFDVNSTHANGMKLRAGESQLVYSPGLAGMSFKLTEDYKTCGLTKMTAPMSRTKVQERKFAFHVNGAAKRYDLMAGDTKVRLGSVTAYFRFRLEFFLTIHRPALDSFLNVVTFVPEKCDRCFSPSVEVAPRSQQLIVRLSNSRDTIILLSKKELERGRKYLIRVQSVPAWTYDIWTDKGDRIDLFIDDVRDVGGAVNFSFTPENCCDAWLGGDSSVGTNGGDRDPVIATIEEVNYTQLRNDGAFKPSSKFSPVPQAYITMPSFHAYQWKICVCSYIDQSLCMANSAFNKLGGFLSVGGPHLAFYNAARKKLHVFGTDLRDSDTVRMFRTSKRRPWPLNIPGSCGNDIKNNLLNYTKVVYRSTEIIYTDVTVDPRDLQLCWNNVEVPQAVTQLLEGEQPVNHNLLGYVSTDLNFKLSLTITPHEIVIGNFASLLMLKRYHGTDDPHFGLIFNADSTTIGMFLESVRGATRTSMKEFVTADLPLHVPTRVDLQFALRNDSSLQILVDFNGTRKYDGFIQEKEFVKGLQSATHRELVAFYGITSTGSGYALPANATLSDIEHVLLNPPLSCCKD